MRTGKFVKTLTGIALAAAMSAGFTGAATAADKNIKIAFLGSQADEDYDGSLVFKDYVESRTNGEIKVDVYFGGQFCGSFQECIDQIMSGVLEVTISTIGGFGNIFPPGQVLDLPTCSATTGSPNAYSTGRSSASCEGRCSTRWVRSG